MNTTEMLAQLRLNTLLEDSAVDYPDSILLREMSDSLVAKYQNLIVGMHSGYWQQVYFQVLTNGSPRSRFPTQVTVIAKVEIGTGSSTSYDDINFFRLPLVREGHADLFEGSLSGTGQPQCYALRGNDIVTFPTPDGGGYVIRVTYFRRPARLYASQNSQSGTDRGRVTAVNTVARTITVNALPFDQSIAVPAAILTGSSIDVVKPSGWFDQSLSNQPITISGLVLTVGGTQPLRDVQAGDYVRAYGQTDWPMIPEDFHRSVVDTTAVKVLVQRGYQQKASNFAGDVSSDLQRFEELYSNRVREEPRIVRAPLLSLRRWSQRG